MERKGLGFEIQNIPVGDGTVLGETGNARILKIKSRHLPLYWPKGLEILSDSDWERIGKILGAYQRSEGARTGPEREEEISNLVSKYLDLLGKDKSRAPLYTRICMCLSGEGKGPFDFLLGDDSLEEIMVNGEFSPIFVFSREHGILETPLAFSSREFLLQKANQLLFCDRKRVDEASPVGHAILPSGERVTVVIPPFSDKPAIDVRKFTEKPFTIPDLVEKGLLTWEIAAFLWLVAERGKTSIGVIGNTGAGKTTLLSALTRLIPPHERIVSVEEISEIKFLHSHLVRLREVEALELGMAEGINETLRLRPDRVVVGEARDSRDVLALRDSCLSGQAFGTYYTYHSDSAALAAERLKSQGVAPADLGAFGIVVVCRRFQEGKEFRTRRIVTEVSELSGEGGRPIPIFSYDFGKGKYKSFLSERKSKAQKWIMDLHLKGERSFSRELLHRAKRLKALAGQSDGEFFKKLWEAA